MASEAITPQHREHDLNTTLRRFMDSLCQKMQLTKIIQS